MALRMRKTKQYFLVAAMAAAVVAGAVYMTVVKPSPDAVAAPLSQSVFCMPNTCNAIEANDSIQDILLRNQLGSSGTRWRIQEDGDTSGDADREVLEIANQYNHYMREITVGVYITSDLYNNMPSNNLRLNFIRRACKTGRDPYWNIAITNPSNGSSSTLATYNYGLSTSNPIGAAARDFCDNVDPVNFNLSNYKSYFVPYSGGGSLMYAQITVRFNTYDPTPPDDERNVRFQMRLDNICGSTTTCREYLALVAVDNAEHRNTAFSVRSPQQKRVTTSSAEHNNDSSTYDLFTQTYNQHMMRAYMEFGLPCDQSSAESRTIYLYDVNDGDSAGAETHGWVGGRDITGVVVQSFNTTTGTWTTLPTSAYTAGQGGSYSGASFAQSHNTNSISTRNHYLYGVGNDIQPTVVFVPTNTDKVVTQIRFRMQPYTKYRVAVTPLSSINFLAAGLPGDQIYGLAGCDTYNLTPIATGSGSIAPGTVAQFSNSIRSDASSSADAQGVQWYSYGFVVPSGQSIPAVPSGNYSNTSQACSGLASCQLIGSGSAPNIMPGALVSVGSTQYSNTAGLSVGDRVCSYLAVNPGYIPSSGDAWRTSTITCYTIVAQPKIHVLGNDLRVGSSFSTGTNLSAMAVGAITPRDGSWVEYAITAPAAVNMLASQSGAFNGSTGSQSEWSKLTFANSGVTSATCPSGYGCFTGALSLGKIPDIRGAVTRLSYNGAPLNFDHTASFSASDIPSIIGGGNLGDFNRSVSITTTGDITINQDIIYSGTHSSAADIPQLILIGRNINIAASVRRVDAWLIASDTINTCGDVPVQTNLRSNICNLPLTVSGPIMASQLELNRTYNDASQPDTAAEIVNLRGDAYIWANNLLKQNGSWQTVYSTELPPRY